MNVTLSWRETATALRATGSQTSSRLRLPSRAALTRFFAPHLRESILPRDLHYRAALWRTYGLHAGWPHLPALPYLFRLPDIYSRVNSDLRAGRQQRSIASFAISPASYDISLTLSSRLLA